MQQVSTIFLNFCSYDKNGNLKGTAVVMPPPAMRLEWELKDPKLLATIQEAFEDSQKIISVRNFT